jgi:ubiquinone/menaquinone biosynthesis C-methylase UbiE
MSDKNEIIKFWESQAQKFKGDVKAVNFDPLEEELEIFFINQLIAEQETICDIGCGNGRTLIDLALKKPKCIFYGLDFSEGMISVANEIKASLNISNITFYHLDAILDNLGNYIDIRFDKIITKRLLINLKGNDKLKAINNIHEMLRENGIYIMIECFLEPLEKINIIRQKLGLSEIKVKYFNEYLSYELLDEIKSMFMVKEIIDFESLYYFISRVFNAYISNGEPDYYAPINKLALKLTKMGIHNMTGYSPEIIILLQKRGNL